MTIEDVVQRGICVGCGGCGVATGGKIDITLNTRGYYSADLSKASTADLETGSRVCPFTNESPNEDKISDHVYGHLAHDHHIGRYRDLWAGRIADEEELVESSSGGLTNWIAKQLVQSGDVDGVIHVGSADSGRLFEYHISRTVDEVNRRRKSTYYATTLADVLLEIKGDGLKYALVGVPCFITAARLVCKHDPVLADGLKFFVGIVCGHMKASGYAESLAWQEGIKPEELAAVDFRIKDPKKSTRHSRFGARRKGETTMHEAASGTLVGSLWGHATFQLNACNFCDDIYAETADIVLGDAWLPKYEADSRGANVVVVRHARMAEILQQGVEDGQIKLDPLSAQAVTAAQAGNFRHRHQGLAVRLADDRKAGKWVPTKRIAPSYKGVTRRRLSLIRTRRRLSEQSFEIFDAARRADNLDAYLTPMRQLIANYDRLGRQPLIPRIKRRASREIWVVRNRVFKQKRGSQ
jgi:coenzyme F420 hydrogenase subunit beta